MATQSVGRIVGLDEAAHKRDNFFIGIVCLYGGLAVATLSVAYGFAQADAGYAVLHSLVAGAGVAFMLTRAVNSKQPNTVPLFGYCMIAGVVSSVLYQQFGYNWAVVSAFAALGIALMLMAIRPLRRSR